MKKQFGISFEILNSSNSYDSNSSFENEKQVVEIDELYNDPYRIKSNLQESLLEEKQIVYSIYHNDKIKYTNKTREEAIKLVEKQVENISKYYSKIFDEPNVDVSTDISNDIEQRSPFRDIYIISGRYKFLEIEVNTVLEIFKIVKI